MSIRNITVGSVAEVREMSMKMDPVTKEGTFLIVWSVWPSIQAALDGEEPTLTDAFELYGTPPPTPLDNFNDVREWAYEQILEQRPEYAGANFVFD
jgi:hypothetical protein